MSYNNRLEFEYKYEMLKALQRIAYALEKISAQNDHTVHQDLANSTGPLIEEKET